MVLRRAHRDKLREARVPHEVCARVAELKHWESLVTGAQCVTAARAEKGSRAHRDKSHEVLVPHEVCAS
jgi:hypothetical protein